MSSSTPRAAVALLRRALLAGAGLGLVISVIACSGSRTEGLEPGKLPEDVRDDYEVFARRCSKCHSLARPLTSGISDDEQWILYVNRMRRQPGSGITMADQERILRFLRYYAAELRRKEAAKRSAPAPADADAAAPPVAPEAPPPPPGAPVTPPPEPAPPSAAPPSASPATELAPPASRLGHARGHG